MRGFGWEKIVAGGWESIVAGVPGTEPPHLGIRYDRAGRFLPEHGNTVVRHVIPGSPTEAALHRLRGLLAGSAAGDRFAFTDVTSWHMTVFDGVVETRRWADHWPADLALDTPIDRMTEVLDARLAGFEGPGDFAMRVVEATPFGLTLAGATAEDEARARAWRDALTVPFGFRGPAHDAYRFHVTVAYLTGWIGPEARADLRAALGAFTEELRATLPALHLGPPAFCRFGDMNAFPVVRALA